MLCLISGKHKTSNSGFDFLITKYKTQNIITKSCFEHAYTWNVRPQMHIYHETRVSKDIYMFLNLCTKLIHACRFVLSHTIQPFRTTITFWRKHLASIGALEFIIQAKATITPSYSYMIKLEDRRWLDTQ